MIFHWFLQDMTGRRAGGTVLRFPSLAPARSTSALMPLSTTGKLLGSSAYVDDADVLLESEPSPELALGKYSALVRIELCFHMCLTRRRSASHV